MLNRRHFNIGFAGLAFAGLQSCATTPRQAASAKAVGYGPLVRDPAGLLDLPPGFSYRTISEVGQRMDDGFLVPDAADGMGSFAFGAGRTMLVRNHELRPSQMSKGPFRGAAPASIQAFDRGEGGAPLPGGTTNLIYNHRSGRVESQHLSLVGTIRNCSGGTTPWGSWLTCEEDVSRAGSAGLAENHGWVFEVPARSRGLVEPRPLTALGRFNHEAAIVDPRTGIVYLTEDRADGLFYRMLPAVRGQLARGGRLQALAFADPALEADSRNWGDIEFPIEAWRPVRWVDLDHVEAPEDDLRNRGHAKSAVLFARGEGITYGDGELYFTCTNGGRAKLGQVMRYRPSPREGQAGEASEPGRVQNFVESTSSDMLNYGDNITIMPTGHLMVCEDQYTAPVRNHLRGITPAGRVYPFALLHADTELAGACFSADGDVMFVNIYSPGKTVAITGPWRSVQG